MLTSQRRKIIADTVRKDSAVTVAQLLELFPVSGETIRKDLLYLEKEQVLTRVRGGAVSKGGAKEFRKFDVRMSEHQQEKRELARLAVNLVKERDVIGIDSGTTAIEFADELISHFHSLTIVTYSVDVFEHLRDHRDFQVILCGGEYLREERVFCGSLARRILQELHMQKVFLFPSAISLRNGICDYEPHILELQRSLIENSDRAFILADSSKWERNALYRICDINPSHIYVTDHALPESVKKLYRESQCQIITERKDLYE